MSKFYLVKYIYLKGDKKTSKPRQDNYSISFEPTIPLYDSYSDVYNRIIRSFISRFEDEDGEIEIDKQTFIKKMMSPKFNFSYEIKKDSSVDVETYTKTKNGIINKLKSSYIEIECEYRIYEIEEENILYTIMYSSNNEEFKIDKVYYGIFKNLEDVALERENFKYFYPDQPANLAILDKSKIYDDVEICKKFVNLGYTKGFRKEAIDTLSYFNPEMLYKEILDIRKVVIEDKNETKKQIENLTKEKEDIEKKNISLTEKISNYESKIEEYERKITNLKNVIKDL